MIPGMWCHGLTFKKAPVYLKYEIQLHVWEHLYHHLVNIVSALIQTFCLGFFSTF